MKYAVKLTAYGKRPKYFKRWNAPARSVVVGTKQSDAQYMDELMAAGVAFRLQERLRDWDVSMIPEKHATRKRNPRARVHSAKWDRCVADVKAKGEAANPYAVCSASLGERESVRPSHRRNASRGDPHKDAKRAARLYREFHGETPHEILRVPHDLPSAAVDVGRVDAIEYTTTRDGKTEHYRHDFDPSRAPDLAAGANGYPLLFIGGRTTFTDRGIEDK